VLKLEQERWLLLLVAQQLDWVLWLEQKQRLLLLAAQQQLFGQEQEQRLVVARQLELRRPWRS
jgi:hypothetical protein